MELWTTKEGFESWWGPDGFRAELHARARRLHVTWPELSCVGTCLQVGN